jgi:undecaprenol kinase
MTKSTAGLRGFLAGFCCAGKGLRHAFMHERNMRIHVAAALLALIACGWLRCTALEWSLVIMLIGLVWAGELFNTAVEALVDRVSPEYHEWAGVVKDVMAAAVLVFALMAVIVGSIVYISAFMRLFT